MFNNSIFLIVACIIEVSFGAVEFLNVYFASFDVLNFENLILLIE